MQRLIAPLAFVGFTFCSVDGARPTAAARPWTPPTLSSDAYESSPTFTPDGREMYFMRADRRFDKYRILWSRCGPDGWSTPAEAPFAAARGVLEADPFVTADGTRLYYVSTRADPRREDLGIWTVARLPGGSWSAPERLPAPVNSTRPELLPRLASDGRLCFGSSRDGGYGQGDIYVATAKDEGNWTVSNVGPPVSTTAFEYEAEISRDGRHLVVVADRGDRSHLYRFEQVDGRWSEIGRVPANDAVFQVGPVLSPSSDRLLFAQDAGARSGEMFLLDLVPNPKPGWPPRCEGR